jgi:chaperone required for assembly of F1-ATPase
MSEEKNPMRAAQKLARPALPRRFYRNAGVGPHEAGFAVLLDGRVARTPAKRPLAVARRDLAEALAAEWAAQKEEIDPATMPLTRLVNAAMDRVAPEMAAVRADIVRHAGSDLILYRAERPQTLVEEEERLWSPILAWAERTLHVRFVLAAGVTHVDQAPAVLEAVARAVDGHDALALAALHSVTTLTGSALIALALAAGRLSAEQAWEAAHADEDWQMRHWGRDETALKERAARWTEMQAAALVLGTGLG